jgi:acyl transferase domain-containing protein/phosphopantetheinyl transferase
VITDVAIVGMACVFPGAPDLATYWQNLRAGVDAIRDVPSGRWDPVFYDPRATSSDRLYCKRGGFVDAFASFDAAAFGIMPVAARGAEPDQLLTLAAAARALDDAGYAARPFARDKAAVILGRGNYAGVGRTRLEQHVRGAEQLVACLRTLLPDLSEAELLRVKREFQARLDAPGPDAAIGLVPNLTASRIANRLDLHGPAFTLDAACASSLVAVDHACAELTSERCDLVLAGGVHLCHDEAFWSVFCQLGALSRQQQIRPFDRRADGLLIGEGIGVVVLKRRIDAERDGDRVYAVIRGAGIASDGREASLMAPRVEGQLLALERAWKSAAIDPASIGLLEAHGTGTAAGDVAELRTLARFFGDASATEPRAVLGSVKSMIGHSMPAAGIAGLIKAALAVHHGALLPTLHCEEPHAELRATRFRVLAREEPWARGATPRRAAVNAFGFGGINAHVVIEEHAPSGPRRARVSVAARADDTRVALFAAATSAELVVDVDARREGRIGAARLCVIDPTPERMARARAIVAKDRPWRGRDEIWFSPRGLLVDGGRIAFAFPGVDASFEPRVDDVAERFGLAMPPFTRANGLEEIGVGIVGVNRLLHAVMGALGVAPDFVLGHSIGEWSAMIATGVIPEDALDAFLGTLEPGTLKVPGVVFAAAGCDVERALLATRGLEDIDVSHDNCPHQVILCGKDDAIDAALASLREDGVLCAKLPFQSGFHSPLFADYVGPHRENFARLPLEPATHSLWSATTCARYPSDPDDIRALAVDHLVRPVRFRELVETLYDHGARVFVQVGTGSLVHFIEDTLRGRPHAACSANVKERSGLDQLRRLAAMLFVEGADPRWDAIARVESFAPRASAPREPIALSLGVPLVRLEPRTPPNVRTPREARNARDVSDQPVPSAFASTMDALARAQTDVLDAFDALEKRAAPRESTSTRTLSVEVFPELLDHSFYRQPPGWPTLSDRHPVVPMTMSIELMIEAARALLPGRVAVGIDDVRALRWIAVSTPIEAQIDCTVEGDDRVRVVVAGYCEGTVVFADAYPSAPRADDAPLVNARAASLTAAELYAERWMFHGPAYQGIVDVGVLGDDGIRGELEAGAAKGALLDNAGQLFGYWVMTANDVNRMAMPVRIDRVRFHAAPPVAGERLTCTVRIRRHTDKDVVADLSLSQHGEARISIQGWEDRRFETDERLWPVMLFPEKNLLAVPNHEGFVVFEDRYRSAPTREQLARRFLGERERADYERKGPRQQRAWLNGRIAAKDAVRHHLFTRARAERGARVERDSLFPVEITIENEPSGRPVVRGAFEGDLRVSIAHKGDVAVALVAEGKDVGIDLERIEARPISFADLSFTPDELRLVGANDDRDEWLTRLWTAKEAVGKARGVGLQGNPRRFIARDRSGERLLVDGVRVETRRFGDFIIGWTCV